MDPAASLRKDLELFQPAPQPQIDNDPDIVDKTEENVDAMDVSNNEEKSNNEKAKKPDEENIVNKTKQTKKKGRVVDDYVFGATTGEFCQEIQLTKDITMNQMTYQPGMVISILISCS